MPRKFTLTWQPGNSGRTGRWRKKYQGKVYYFDGGRGKFDRDAYEAAVGAWEAVKVGIDAKSPRTFQPEYESAIAQWEQVLAWSSRHGDNPMAVTAHDKLESLRKRLEAPVLKELARADKFDSIFEPISIRLPDSIMDQVPNYLARGEVSLGSPIELSAEDRTRYLSELDGSPSRIAREIWRDRLTAQQCRAASVDDSVCAHVELFLRQKQGQAAEGQVSVGRHYALKLHLSHFQDWIGKDTAVREIDGKSLLAYLANLLENVKRKSWSRWTASDYLASVKSFVRWLWQVEAIPSLPRVLDGKSKLLKVGRSIPDVVVFTKDEVSELLKSASDRTKLYLLLMLNCGMTQKDISDLLIGEVDWTEGRIIRKRSKTSQHDNVPTVNYLLWPETLRLLKQERSLNSHDRVLINSNGEPLWTESMGESGKYKKTDNIKNAFERLRKPLGIAGPLKSLKKTSATLLRGNERFQGLHGLFLGHAPQSMSDKHYTKVPQSLLDQAIQWLETEFGLSEQLIDGKGSDGRATPKSTEQTKRTRSPANERRPIRGGKTSKTHSARK